MRELGHLEADVMAVIWNTGTPMTTRAVLDELREERPLAYTTVMTVLDHLRGKGLLTRIKHGRAYSYEATQSREQYTATIMERILASSVDPAATLLHFVEQIPVDEAKRLRDVLAAAAPGDDPSA